MYRLPRLGGFPQRHQEDPRPSWYLKHLWSLSSGDHWRSPVTISEIRKDIYKFKNNSVDLRGLDPTLEKTILLARDAFRLPAKVKMLHLNDVFTRNDLNIWSSSPGLPWTTHNYKTKRDIRNDPEAVQRVRLFWHMVKAQTKIMHAPDCCAFVRSHVVERGEIKVRAVWGYPATITFGEAVFALPLIDEYQVLRSSPIAYGYETALGGSKKLLDEVSRFTHFAGIDFSAFDKTVPKWLIDIAFAILAENLDFGEYQGFGTARSLDMFYMYNYIRTYFVRTPIRLCSGERYRKSSGIASGSYFTQLVGSIVNYIIMNYCSLTLTGAPQPFIRVLGDDSIIANDIGFCVEKYADIIKSKFDMELNLKKTVVSRNIGEITFLGYQINDGFPSKPFDSWITSLLFPEKMDTSWDDVASRAVGLIYANCGVNVEFDNVCRTIIAQRDFTLSLTKNFNRMLRTIGIKDVQKHPPCAALLSKKVLDYG